MVAQDSSDSEEAEQEQKNTEEPKEEAQKKKKKRKNKKKKKKQDGPEDTVIEETKEKPKDEELAFLDQVIEETKEEYKQMGLVQRIDQANSVLAMQRVNFNFNRKLKSLFAKVIGGNQVQNLEEEKKEARPQNNYDGYSKKQRRILIMQEKLAQR